MRDPFHARPESGASNEAGSCSARHGLIRSARPRARRLLVALLLSAPAAFIACSQPAVWHPVPLPHDRHGHRTERIDGGVIVFGGFGPGADHDSAATWWLANGADVWQRLADLTAPRAFFGSVVWESEVHALGDGVLRFDSSRQVWRKTVPDGVLPHSHFGCALVGSTVWVLGGYPVERSACFAVDLGTGAIAQHTPPPSFIPGDHFHFVAELAGELHVIGGLDGNTFQPRREHWVLRNDLWRNLSEPPAGLWVKFGAQAQVAGRLHLFGKFGHWAFDPTNGAWQERAPVPFVTAMSSAVVEDGTIWVLGGQRLEGEGDVLLAYDALSDSWRDLVR